MSQMDACSLHLVELESKWVLSWRLQKEPSSADILILAHGDSFKASHLPKCGCIHFFFENPFMLICNCNNSTVI